MSLCQGKNMSNEARIDCGSNSYHRNAQNLGAGNDGVFGPVGLAEFERQHRPDVQFASDPVAYPSI